MITFRGFKTAMTLKIQVGTDEELGVATRRNMSSMVSKRKHVMEILLRSTCFEIAITCN